jgi:hypothetical protein
MAVAITRFASTIVALLEGLVADAVFAPIYEADLVNGQHRNPTDEPAYFTTSYFHYPQELKDEIIAAGFKFEALLAIEGPARLMKDFAEQWEKKKVREKVLAIVGKVEAEPNLWGVSAHIMGIGKKGRVQHIHTPDNVISKNYGKIDRSKSEINPNFQEEHHGR